MGLLQRGASLRVARANAPDGDPAPSVTGSLRTWDDDELHVGLPVVPEWLGAGHVVHCAGIDIDGVIEFATHVVHADAAVGLLQLAAPAHPVRWNRRRHPRVVTRVPVEWTPIPPGSRIQHLPGETVDLALGGLRFRSTPGPAVGTTIMLSVALPGGAANGLATVLGETIRGDGPIVRIRFDRLHPESLRRVDEAVEHVIRASELRLGADGIEALLSAAFDEDVVEADPA